MIQEQDITTRFQEGVKAVGRKEYKTAKEHFEAVLAATPGNPEALSFLGFTEASMGNVKTGLEKTSQARAANPANPQNLVNHAYALNEAGRKDEAIADLQEAYHLAPAEITISNQLSRLLFEAERYIEVEGVVRDLFEKSPKDPLVANRLVITLIKNGKGEEAFEIAGVLQQRFGENPFIWGILGRTARATDRIEIAMENFQKLSDHDPKNLFALKSLSHCLMLMEMFNEAIPVLEKILKQDPECADSLYSVGYAMHNTNRAENGIPFINRSLEFKPDNAEALLIKGHNHVYMGEFEEAKKAYKRVLELDPDSPEAYLKMMKIDPPKKQTEVFNILQRMVENPDLKPRKKIVANFVLGEMYESLKDYDTAFSYFAQGNKLSGSGYDENSPWLYRPEASEQKFADISRVYSKELFETLSFRGSDSPIPIFIVGIPRSGTTLLEQIISSHSKVHGAGELAHGSKIANQMTGMMGGGTIAEIEKAFLEKGAEWGGSYLEYLPKRGPGVDRVTDKMPNNFLHLGLLQVILPKAKFIHISRNPLDTCLSIHSKLFSRAFSHARDLYTLGHYYRQYRGLMAHWQKILPQPLLEVCYEDLVDKSETLAPEILEFCGLEWEPECLEFYKHKSNVRTMSTFQVRNPINKSSIGKWRCYEKHIGPLLEGLGEDIVSTLKLD